MLPPPGRPWLRPPAARCRGRQRPARAQRGQVLPIFAVMSVVLLGGAALLTDVAWWWTNEQRMQRAADAAALAGAVYLPGNQTLAFSTARAEAAKNGFVHDATRRRHVTPRRDPDNPRKLIVDIDGAVETNFARVFGLQQVDVGVTGAAEYVLPVPMGSPQNYYGVSATHRAAHATPQHATQVHDRTNWGLGWRSPISSPAELAWSEPGTRAYLERQQQLRTRRDGHDPGLSSWSGFGSSGIPDRGNDETVTSTARGAR